MREYSRRIRGRFLATWLAAAAFLLANAGTARGAAYTAIDLYKLTNLNPTGFATSVAYGVSGNQQVGAAAVTSGGVNHAMIWTSSAGSAVDLSPTNLPNITSSSAYATDGSHQVGIGNNDAMLWSGTAASAVDLMPPGFSNSFAYGLTTGQQVGAGYNNRTNVFNAMLWSGSVSSFVDLNGTGYSDTQAYGTNGTQQVGLGFTPANNGQRALVWSGTADSAVDLGLYLSPSLGTRLSEAYSIDASGDIFGLALDQSFTYHVIEWVPQAVPEPGSLALFIIAGHPLGFRRRAKR